VGIRGWVVTALAAVVVVSGLVFVSRPSDSVTAATNGSAPDVPGAMSLGRPAVEEGGNPPTTLTEGEGASASTVTSARDTTASTEGSFEVASRPPDTTTTTIWDPESPTTTTAPEPSSTTTTRGYWPPSTTTTTSRPGPGTPSTTEPPSTTTTTEPPAGFPPQPRIVYTRQVQQDAPYDMDLFASDLDGGNEAQLTRGPGQDKDPAVSPDGRTVAFIRVRTESQATDQVWLMDSDGRNLRMVYSGGPASMADPAWSPDGRSLAITAGYNLAAPPNYRWRVGISVLDLQTGHLTDVTIGTPQLDRDATPAWSPDGTKIAFARQRAEGSDESDYNIFTVNRNGSGLTQITFAPADFRFDSYHWPTWSADGQRMLVYHQGGAGVVILDLDDLEEHPIAGDNDTPGSYCGGTLGPPTWSPDEQFVIFSACQGLRLAATDGSGMWNLDPEDHTQWRWYPSWLH
jgi:hypothetical protein